MAFLEFVQCTRGCTPACWEEEVGVWEWRDLATSLPEACGALLMRSQGHLLQCSVPARALLSVKASFHLPGHCWSSF